MIANGVGGNGVALTPAQEMAIFDTLPLPVRRMAWNFALPLSAPALAAQCQAHGMTRADKVMAPAFEALNRRVLPGFRDRHIRIKYGDDHPMIGRPLREDWS